MSSARAGLEVKARPHTRDQLGLASPSGVLFAVNATMVLLGVHAPVTEALTVGVQAIAAVLLLATHVRRTSPPRPPPPARAAG
ncbi:hypothetical protein [Streptomyces sp. NRRL F-5135]|uniref:hypothetical protein n=1 Tax=Streptomyces sp. NRRL F-5135 TaxID=1463858 RepID=UPI00131ACE8B|nr:hypothetical protein [Streptomyces sp. NRRL F-5135]